MVRSWIFPCGPAITANDIIGPDAIEDEGSITIRYAYSVPLVAGDDPSCREVEQLEDHLDDPPIRITVHLREPLGDRAILDGNQYPAAPIRMEPEPQEEPPPPPPTIELPGGTNEVQIMAVKDNDCTPEGPAPCGVPSAQPELTVTAGSESATGSTDETGSATLVVPEGLVRVEASADGLWCPTVHFNAGELPSSLTIACVRLDLPHATVTGTLTSTGEGDGWVATFVGPSPMRSVAVAVEPDGTFEAVLDPGTWRVGAMNTDWTQTCTVGPVTSVDVVDGQDQTLDLTCD